MKEELTWSQKMDLLTPEQQRDVADFVLTATRVAAQLNPDCAAARLIRIAVTLALAARPAPVSPTPESAP